MAVQFGQNIRHLTILGHHVLDCYKIGKGCVHCGKKEGPKYKSGKHCEGWAYIGFRQNIHHIIGSQRIALGIDQFSIGQSIHGRTQKQI